MPPKKMETSVLVDGWEKIAVELYGLGNTDAQVRSVLDITVDMFYRWLRDDITFAKTIKKGRDLSLAYWEKKLAAAAETTYKGNITALIFLLKSRFRDIYGDDTPTDWNKIIDMDNAKRLEMIMKMIQAKHVQDAKK